MSATELAVLVGAALAAEFALGFAFATLRERRRLKSRGRRHCPTCGVYAFYCPNCGGTPE